MEKCVHTEHCCREHGCKYNDSDCPVVLGSKPQSHPCEVCDEYRDHYSCSTHSLHVRVGTGIIVVKNGKVLVGKRKGAHAAGLVSFPGGHLDYNESWVECVLRELREECGKDFIVKIRPFGEHREEFFVTNDIMPQYGKHYVTIFMVADWVAGEPINGEPHKCDGWEWIDYDQLAELSQHKECANWVPMHLISAFRQCIGI